MMPNDQHALEQQDIAHRVPGNEDAILSSPDASFMEPFGAAAGGIALIGGIVKAASVVKTTYSDYQQAEKDGQHVQRQKEQLRINQSLLKSHQFERPDHFDGVHNAFTEATNSLVSQRYLDKKRDKIVWAAFGEKRKAQKDISKLKEIESSMGVTLQLKTLDQVEKFKNSLEGMEKYMMIREDSHSSRLRLLEEAYDRDQEIIASLQKRPEQQMTAKVYRFQRILCLGIHLHLVLGAGPRPNHALSLSFPLFYMVFILRLSFMFGWPRCPRFSLRQKIEIQSDSEIFKACQQNNILLIQRLLTDCGGLVNCTTPDNLTPLRFAIRAGHAEAVKFLLDNGADPNQTFGSLDTSPLNNAFLVGSPSIIRFLLAAKADLYHLNSRVWTSLFYLWDPDPYLCHHSTTCEILAICSEQDFMGWEFTDALGWAPIHRAAAFGHPDHIRMLFDMRVVSRDVIPVNVTQWSPIQCAARHGNIPAFQTLVEEYRMPHFELLRMRDNRGWNLLHLAAAGGSEEMIVYLLSLGIDPTVESDAASLLLQTELKYKRSTPQKVAEVYGFFQQYDNAMRYFESTRSPEDFYKSCTEEPQLLNEKLDPSIVQESH